MKKNVLFVCTGNTCRSPMAEAIFHRLLTQKGTTDKYSCSSAGVYAYEGDGASPEAQQAVKKFGLDISRHYARTLDEEIISKAWLILTMTGDHKRMILEVYPEALDKVFTLKEYAEQGNRDITDPFGCGIEAYKACAEELETVLLKISDKL